MANIQTDNIQNIFPWINEQFFSNILRNEYSNAKSVQILNYTLKPALKPGENYTSEMIRVKVNYVISESNDKQKIIDDQREISFIIKTKLCNEQLKADLDEGNIFEKEIVIYRDILPAVQKLLSTIDADLKFSAKCFETINDTNKCYLVLEDLLVAGYKNIDRHHGLDMEHFKMVLAKLAKFHATTAVLDSKNLLPRKLFNESAITENSETYKKMITTSFQTMTEYTAITPGFKEINANLNRVQDKIFEKICSVVKRNDSVFNALLHGDLWSNNMMFVYDDTDNSLRDVIMVDYQEGFWGSIGLDLAYTIFSSTNESACNESNWDYLLKHYHQTLSETLIKLKYPKAIPSLYDIHAEFLRCGVTYAAFGIIVQGIRRLENVQDDVLSKFIYDTEENRQYRLNMLTKPDMQNVLKFLLNFYDRKGFFD